MNLNLLQTFVLVAREGGFRNAAEKHFLTPSAVSSRIRLLEKEVGAKLFERGQFGSRLTLSGERLLDHADDMLSTWKRIRRDVAIPPEASHILAIGATDTIWHAFLLNALSTLHMKNPDMALRLETGTSGGLIREVTGGSLDAIFLFESPDLPALRAEVVAEVSLVLVSTNQDSTLERVINDDFVRIEWGKADESFQDQIAERGNAPMIRTSVGWLGLQWLLKQGGAAYLPETLIESDLASGLLCRVPDAPVLKRRAHLIQPLQSGRSHEEIAGYLQMLATLIKG